MKQKIIVVGDIHLGKKFNTYKSNAASELQHTNLSPYWTEFTLKYLYSTLVENSTKVDMIVFLGDIFDKPTLRPEDVNKFTQLLDDIYTAQPQAEIHIIVGNHDTNNPQSPYGTLLYMYNSRKNVTVHSEATLVDSSYLMLPYYKKENLSDVLSTLSTKLTNQPVIFSHNDFYVNDTFIMTEMINVELLKELFGEETIIFNGHIHNFYYEPSSGILFTGSVSPTSFKDSPMASGICYVEIDTSTNTIHNFKQFSNPYIIFVTIDNKNHISTLEQYLVKYRQFGSKVVLRYSTQIKKEIEPILNMYSDIIWFYKDRLSGEDETLTIQTSKRDELRQVTEKVKSLLTNNSPQFILDTFKQYIKQKYGFSIDEFHSLN